MKNLILEENGRSSMAKLKPPIRERWYIFIRFWQIVGVVLAESWTWIIEDQSLPDYLYRVVLRLGPTFIRLGQVASARSDLIPEEILIRLKMLQEKAPQFSFAEVRQVIEAELRRPLNEAFPHFPEGPVAAAPLAQVYLATLPDGAPVAVKVQRPGIDTLITRDLEILRWLARLAHRLSRTVRELNLETAVIEFERWIVQELDFSIEGQNAEEFRRNLAEWGDATFPRVHWSHTSRHILTMERVPGPGVKEETEQVGRAFSNKLARRRTDLEMMMFIWR